MFVKSRDCRIAYIYLATHSNRLPPALELLHRTILAKNMSAMEALRNCPKMVASGVKKKEHKSQPDLGSHIQASSLHKILTLRKSVFTYTPSCPYAKPKRVPCRIVLQLVRHSSWLQKKKLLRESLYLGILMKR